MTALASSLSLGLASSLSNVQDLNTAIDRIALDLSDSLADGAGADQAQQHWADTRSVVSAADDLNLTATLVNGFGLAVTFTAIKAILIRNRNMTTAHFLEIGGDAAALLLFGAVADFLILGPGGVLALWSPVDGWPVTGATGDILQISSITAAVTIIYDIVIIGTGTAA